MMGIEVFCDKCGHLYDIEIYKKCPKCGSTSHHIRKARNASLEKSSDDD